MRRINWLISVLVIVFSGYFNSAVAKEEIPVDSLLLNQKIEQAIVSFEQTPRNDWAFQVERYENEEGDITSSVERFIPNIEVDKRWHLLKLNGQQPTVNEQKSFLKKKQKAAQKKADEHSFSLNMRDLINQEHLQFLAEDNDHISMNYPIELAKLGDDAVGKLQGTLRYNKQKQFIEEITIVNTAEFSPVFSATISNAKLSFSFISIDGAILPFQQKFDMKGRFAFFTEIDETSTDTYSNYEFKGGSDE